MSGIFLNKDCYNLALFSKTAASNTPYPVGVFVFYLAGSSESLGSQLNAMLNLGKTSVVLVYSFEDTAGCKFSLKTDFGASLMHFLCQFYL